MDIVLEFRQKRTLCDQIQDQIREQIATKRLLPGDQLPAVRDLAASLDINFNTVARAYRALDLQGWITTQQGRGTYVLGLISEPESETTGPAEPALVYLLERFLAEIERQNIPIDQVRYAIKDKLFSHEKALKKCRRIHFKRISRKPRFHAPLFEKSKIRKRSLKKPPGNLVNVSRET